MLLGRWLGAYLYTREAATLPSFPKLLIPKLCVFKVEFKVESWNLELGGKAWIVQKVEMTFSGIEWASLRTVCLP